MEPTLANTSTLDWLRIDLEVQRTAAELTFRLTFRNESDAPQQVPFPVKPRNAEFLGLLITDATGERVRPDRKYIGRYPISPDDRPVQLQPGERWTYDLTGTLANEVLDFPSTQFHLSAGHPYHVQFRCKQVVSNQATLTV